MMRQLLILFCKLFLFDLQANVLPTKFKAGVGGAYSGNYTAVVTLFYAGKVQICADYSRFSAVEAGVYDVVDRCVVKRRFVLRAQIIKDNKV